MLIIQDIRFLQDLDRGVSEYDYFMNLNFINKKLK